MRAYTAIAFLMTSLCLMSCQEDDDVFEELDKLRGLGVSISPLIGTPSTKAAPQVVTLKVHATVPKGDEIAISTFVDTDNVVTPNIDNLTLTAKSESYQDFTTLRYYTASATFTVPTMDVLKPRMIDGAVNLRYAFLLTSGAEVEKIVGNVVVLDPDSDEGKKTWKDASFSIVVPTTSDDIAKNSDVDVKGKVENPNSEEIKIGWFVSGGKLKNRRARETTWETIGTDKQLLIGTVRGKRSHSFSIDVKEYAAK